MTDKYFRLVTILVNICAGPLRELFLKHAKTDPKSKAPYTTLDAYLLSRKSDIMKLKSKKVLRQHQYDLLFPPSAGQADLNTWDLTLLALMLTNIFKTVLQSSEIACIDVIRDIRNNLQHISGTCQITNSEFDNVYKQLLSNTIQLASSAMGQGYSDKIKTDIENAAVCVLTDLGDVLRQWYLTETSELKDNIRDLKEELGQLKDEMKEIKEDTSQTRQTLKKTTVKRPMRGGKMSKRFKTEDHILDNMRSSFVALMRHEINKDFQSPPESSKIATELKENHLVVVSGYGKCLFQQTAISVINSLDYPKDKCVVVSCPSDWRHIGTEDVDLVVFLNPFGKTTFDKDKARSMNSIFDNICESTQLSTEDDTEDFVDVMIITEQSILDECKAHFNHDVIEDPVIVYKPTTEDSPVDLADSENPVCSVSTDPHYRNLLVQSIAYCKHHRMQLEDRSILEDAQELFRLKKVIVISGPRESGKTTLALSLLSSYQEGHYLILTEPGDLIHIRFDVTCVVVIEDLGGKYTFEMSFIQQWLRKFDMLYSAIKEGKMNVIITCNMEKLQACMIDASKHPILNSVITLKKSGIVKVKQEPSTEGYPGSSFLNSYKTKPMASFTGVKTIKNVDNLFSGNEDLHDFCQYIDGSFMFVTGYIDNIDDEYDKFIVTIGHFTSDFQKVSIFKHQTDISVDWYYTYCCICCTDTGELVVTCNKMVYLCRITNSSIQVVKSTQMSDHCLSLCFTMNRISCLLCGTDGIEVFDKHLKKKKTITLYNRDFDDPDFVSILNQTYIYNKNDDDIVFEDPRQKQLKYLREEGFEPVCLCAACEDSVFVLGKQGGENNRILQVNKDVKILTDILIGNDELSLNRYSRYKIEFDESNSRLVLLKTNSKQITEIYLK